MPPSFLNVMQNEENVMIKPNVKEIKRGKTTVYVLVSGELKAIDVRTMPTRRNMIAEASSLLYAQTSS